MKGLATTLACASVFAFLGLAIVGCGGSAQTVTPEQEKSYRNPPKEPPAEYKPNQIGMPPPPPSNTGKK